MRCWRHRAAGLYPRCGQRPGDQDKQSARARVHQQPVFLFCACGVCLRPDAPQRITGCTLLRQYWGACMCEGGGRKVGMWALLLSVRTCIRRKLGAASCRGTPKEFTATCAGEIYGVSPASSSGVCVCAQLCPHLCEVCVCVVRCGGGRARAAGMHVCCAKGGGSSKYLAPAVSSVSASAGAYPCSKQNAPRLVLCASAAWGNDGGPPRAHIIGWDVTWAAIEDSDVNRAAAGLYLEIACFRLRFLFRLRLDSNLKT